MNSFIIHLLTERKDRVFISALVKTYNKLKFSFGNSCLGFYDIEDLSENKS